MHSLSRKHFSSKNKCRIFSTSGPHFSYDHAQPITLFKLDDSELQNLENYINEFRTSRVDNSIVFDCVQTVIDTYGDNDTFKIDTAVLFHYFSYLLNLSAPGEQDESNDDQRNNVLYLQRLHRKIYQYLKKLETNNTDSHPITKNNNRGEHTESMGKFHHINPHNQEKIMSIYISGYASYSNLAVAFNCSKTAIARIIKSNKERGCIHPNEASLYHKKTKIEPDVEKKIDCFITENNGVVSAYDIKEYLQKSCEIACSTTIIYTTLHKLGYHKSISSLIPKNYSYNLMRSAQFLMLQKFLHLIISDYYPISIDETGYIVGNNQQNIWQKTGMSSARINRNPISKINFIIAVSYHDICYAEAHEGSTNQFIFFEYLRNLFKHIKHAQKKAPVKYFIFCDNAKYHKTRSIKALITKYQVPCLFNVPYCCHFNPAELFFNICKAYLRKKMPQNM